MSEPEPAPEPKLFESQSRSRSGNKKFRLHNTAFYDIGSENRVPVPCKINNVKTVTITNTRQEGSDNLSQGSGAYQNDNGYVSAMMKTDSTMTQTIKLNT
jgi:hypothetical protein